MALAREPYEAPHPFGGLDRSRDMLLESKTAVIYGAAGATGAAVARAFAREGARLYLTGRTAAPLAKLAAELGADAMVVDALDERAVADHLARVPRVDISYNAIGIPQQGIQGTPLVDLALEPFLAPVTTYARSQFITARLAARRMVSQRGGVILMHTPSPARTGAPLVGGMGIAWAAMESLSRQLSAELAPHGVRALCVRTTGIPETATIDVVFGLHAKAAGITRGEFQSLMESSTHRKKSTTLAELGDVVAFLASDRAAGMTGAVANLTGGMITD
jgi:NAD(P)-dependent dehydrogenase (short-subunit alcohol dehydrogenase family)